MALSVPLKFYRFYWKKEGFTSILVLYRLKFGMLVLKSNNLTSGINCWSQLSLLIIVLLCNSTLGDITKFFNFILFRKEFYRSQVLRCIHHRKLIAILNIPAPVHLNNLSR